VPGTWGGQYYATRNADLLQACISTAWSGTNNDKTVHVSGKWAIDHQVTVYPFVNVVGDYTYGDHHAVSGQTFGTRFEISGTYSTSCSGITWIYTTIAGQLLVGQGARVAGVTFVWPDNLYSGQTSLASRCPAIGLSPINGDRPDNIHLENLYFTNAYVGIQAITNHEMLTIKDLNYAVTFRGIVIDGNTDIDRIENVQFGHIANQTDPYYVDGINQQSNYDTWLRSSCVAVVIAGSDWLWINKVFAFGYQDGFWLRESALYTQQGGNWESAFGTTISNSGCDHCTAGVFADNTRPYSTVCQVTVEHSQFTGDRGIYLKNVTCSVPTATNCGGVNLHDNQFWGIAYEAIRCETCRGVSVGGNMLRKWGGSGGSAGIYLPNNINVRVYGNTGENGSGVPFVSTTGSTDVYVWP
jgi:hypothetical protein